MTRCLITGSTGFVGQHLVKYLRQNTDWQINPIAKHYDYIINLASGSSVEKSIADPVVFIEDNINCMLDILERARMYPPKVFLHMSTVEVYNSSNPYAASKAAQEVIANAYQNTYGLPVVIVTSHNIIGAGQKSDKFVPKIIQQIKKGEELSIYVQNGTMGYRIYNPVENVCNAILYLLKAGITSGKYNISGGAELTNLEMAKKIAKLLGKPLKYKTVEAQSIRPGYTRHLVSDGIALETLGWKPPKTLDEGLAWVK